MVVTLLVCLALVFSMSPRQAASPERSQEEARAILKGNRALQAADVAVLRAGLRAALAGRFLTIRLEKPLQDGTSEAEYQLDPTGEIRFQRLTIKRDELPDEISINEVTELPAVLCRDRKPRDGRLGLSYTYWRGQWQNVQGRVHMGHHEIDMLWDLPAADVSDGGAHTFKGRRVRVVPFGPPPLTHAFWVDVETLLPLRYSMKATLEGKTHEVFETIEYPAGKSIERPAGLKVPDCV
jgi:hypothetical protein